MASENEHEIVELTYAQGEVDTMTRGEAAQSVHPITVDGMGRITIYVREEDLAKARVVLKEYRETE